MKNGRSTTRKIQFVSNATYAFSLPKQWVETTIGTNPDEVKQQKLVIIPMQDESLAIYPDKNRGSAKFETSLQIGTEPMENSNFLKRRVISKYLAGYQRILLKSDQTLTPELVQAAKEIVPVLSGWELIEMNAGTIILQDRLLPGQLSLSQVLKVMGRIVSSATLSALHALTTHDQALARKSSQLAATLKQYHYLILRQLKRILANPQFRSEHELRLAELIAYHSAVQLLTLLSTHVEEVAAELRAILGHSDYPVLSENPAFKETQILFKAIESKLTGLCKGAIAAFFAGDEETAYRLIQTGTHLHPLILSVKRLSPNLPPDFALNFNSIGDGLLQITDTLCTLCELTINREALR